MVENNNMTDSEIMLKVAGYDSKALEQLYDRYSPLLFTLIKKVVGDAKSAEEVLSDVFVIIWRKIDRFDFASVNIFTWLISLTRNKAVDVVRRSRGYENMLAYTDGYEDKFILPKLSRQIKVLELSAVLKMSSSIKEAISTLTDAQKYVIELSFYDGFDEKEIAKKLNIPFPTVKSKLLLALGILYKKLSDEPVAETNKNKMVDTIKAAVIGCLSNDELTSFSNSMESDENFPWRELGEYQNLAALLPAALTIELPAAALKDNVARKLYRIKDEILAKQKKSIPVEVEEPIEKPQTVKEEKKIPLVAKEEGVSFKEPDLSNIHIPSHREVEYSDEGVSITDSLETPFSDGSYGRERSKHITAKSGTDREIIEKTVKEYIGTYYQGELESIQKGMKRNLFVSIAFFIILLILVALVFLRS